MFRKIILILILITILIPSSVFAADPLLNTTALTSDGTTASASNSYGEYRPFNAFDKDLSKGWYCNYSSATDTQWLQYKFDAGTTVTRFGISVNVSQAARGAKDFILKGSNDGSTFNDLYVGVASTWTGSYQYFDVASPATYVYYRLYIKSVQNFSQSSNLCAVSEMEFYGYVGSGGGVVHNTPVLTEKSFTQTTSTLEWTGNGDTYDLFRNGTAILSGTTLKTYTDTLSPGVSYSYYVVSHKGSDTKQSNGLALVGKDTDPGGGVTHNTPTLTYSNVTDTSATLSWTGNGDMYDVYQNGAIIGSNITSTQYIVANLSPGQTYGFYVISKKASAANKTSNTVTFTCLTSQVPDPQIDNSGILDWFGAVWDAITSTLNAMLVIAYTIDTLNFDETLLPYLGYARYVMGDYNYVLFSSICVISLGIFIWVFIHKGILWSRSILPW